MKHTPITDPKHTGCLCCPRPESTLDKDNTLDVGFGSVELKFEYADGTTEDHLFMSYYSAENDDYIEVEDTPESVVTKYAEQFGRSVCTTLFFARPLRDDTWEYNKDDGEWYLIKQGMGFA